MTTRNTARVDRTWIQTAGYATGQIWIRPEHRAAVAEMAGAYTIACVGHRGADPAQRDIRYRGDTVLLSVLVQIAPDGGWSWGSMLTHSRPMTGEERDALVGMADPAKCLFSVGEVMGAPADGNDAGSISYGEICALGIPGTNLFAGYVHSCDTRYAKGGRSLPDPARPTIEEAIADAEACLRHDPLYRSGRPALMGPNAWMDSGGTIHDPE